MAKKGKKLKIAPKYFSYENLPDAKLEDFLMANYGMNMDPGPRFPTPQMGRNLANYYQGDSPVDMQPAQVQGPAQIGSIDTDKIKLPQLPGISPRDMRPPQEKGEGSNFGNAALLGLAAFDALLPNPYNRQTVVQPQMAYNPNPYGTGSQALMEQGGYMENGGDPPLGQIVEPGQGGLPIYVPKDVVKKVSLKDARTVNPATGKPFKKKGTKTIDASEGNIRAIISHAKALGVDPYNALAIAMQETELGSTDPNLGHVVRSSPYWNKDREKLKKMRREDANAHVFISAMKDKADYAQRLAKRGIIPDDEVYRLQSYNGFGKLVPETEADYHGGLSSAFYEIPVSRKNPLDLKKNPAYGKTVMSLRDEVLRKNPQIASLVDTVEPFQYQNGGYIMGEDENNTPSAKDGKWIQKAINPAHKGYCTPMTKSTCTPRRKALAKTLKKMAKNRKKDEGGFIQPGWDKYKIGGIIPDDMSVFNPHEYAHGGNVNGSADVRAVGASYPNTDLIEQWLLYEQGGNVNGGAKTKDVGAKFPNSDLIEQWLLYADGGNVNGKAKVKDVGAAFPNTDLIEQWLLYKNGGTLSASKAKEMLRDGTANGKKLTKKQRQYFGMVASGKAALGDVISGDPTKPVKKDLMKPLNQGPGEWGISGTDSFTDNQFAMGHGEKRTAYGIDIVNSIVSSGLLPHETNYKGAARQLDPQMLTYLYQFNQRPDLKGMTPEQRVKTFYDIPSNPEIQSMKDDMKRYGYGPLEFRRGQALAPAQALPPANGAVSAMKSGGVLYDDGGAIDTMWGGSANLESYNPFDGGMVEFNGNSHAQGGIGMQYNGNPVEVEGGEFASRDPEGNLSIYGNMFIPGTKTKFKKAAGAIADKEKKYDRVASLGVGLVNDANPANKWEQLKFNAGKVMMQGGQMGMADLASKKERLSSLQRSMLDMAAQHGLDPHEMSRGKMKKAKKGASISSYENGGDPGGNDPTRADRNRNPGNIKYGEFAKKYGARKDKDGFAIFPNLNSGLQAMKDLLKTKGYSNLSVSDAISRWTDNHPYRYDLGNLSGKKVSDLTPEEFEKVIGTMRVGEGTAYGVTPRTPRGPSSTTPPRVNVPQTFTPYGIPEMSLTPEVPRINPLDPVPPYDQLEVPERGPIPSNVEPLHLNQVLPEIFAAATNKVEPVPAQRYEPQLYTPYQVSFQDRINQNQSAFNAQMRAVGSGNPSAIGALAAQKYQADQSVLGDEFRTNQAISSDITNKNIALVNDANLKNLGIADTQMVRQSQARSNTRAQNQMILNSLSGKYAQNEFENKRLAAYENLYDYRFVPQDDGGLSATYFGPNAMFNYQGRTAPSGKAQDVRTISRYDAQGNLKGYAEYDESDLREMQRILDIQSKQRKLPLMPLQPLK